MKKLLSLAFIVLGLATATAFAQANTAPVTPVESAAGTEQPTSAAKAKGKHKQQAKKGHKKHKKHKKKSGQ